MSDVKEAADFVKAFEKMRGRMPRHRREAMILSEAGKRGEERQLEQGIDYSEQHVRLATVHARQDMMLMVSYLSDIAGNIRTIMGWVAFMGWMAFFAFAWYVGVPFLKLNNWWPF